MSFYSHDQFNKIENKQCLIKQISFFSLFCRSSFIIYILIHHTIIVGHHIYIPSSLEPLIDVFDILVKVLTKLCTIKSQMFWNVVDMRMHQVHFYSYIAAQLLEMSLHCLNHFPVIWIVIIPQEVVSNTFERNSCVISYLTHP